MITLLFQESDISPDLDILRCLYKCNECGVIGMHDTYRKNIDESTKPCPGFKGAHCCGCLERIPAE